jgi:hypothetical protein
MRAFVASAGPPEAWTSEQRAEYERLKASQPLVAEIAGVEALALELFNEERGNGDEWLECLLLMALRHAKRMNEGNLMRVLNALVSAHQKGELPKLLGRKSNTTMVGHADAYLGKESVVGGPRVTWAKRIAQAFDPEPGDEAAVEHRAKVVCGWLHNSGAEQSLGAPRQKGDEPSWPLRVVAECCKLRATKPSTDRRPYHYARAVLRGWGMTSAQADDAVAPAERESLK